jgi:hypothetical protein
MRREDAINANDAFTTADLDALSVLVADAWWSARARDWSVRAGTLDWSCLATADHAVDCVYAPAMFLVSRKQDAYPDIGVIHTLGDRATPARLVESLRIATRLLAGVVKHAAPDVRAVIFRWPSVTTAAARGVPPPGGRAFLLQPHHLFTPQGVPVVNPAEFF